MTKRVDGAFTRVSSWAVGRLADTLEIAIRLNDFSPILMSVADAKEIAAALNSEAESVARLKPAQPPVSAVASRQAPKRKPG